MRAGSLFSGIGGLDLGLHAALGCEPAWFCEADKHCHTVLERHWPGVPIYPDVRDLPDDIEPVDVLHGGYPCQPFSHAGVRKGEDDPRHLWPAFLAAVRVLRPRLVVGENVAGHLSLGFDRVLGDLAEVGYGVRWGVVRASDTGAPHQRARLFWVAWDAERGGRDGRPPVEGRGSIDRSHELLLKGQVKALLPTPAAQEPGGTAQAHLDRKNRLDGANRVTPTHLSLVMEVLQGTQANLPRDSGGTMVHPRDGGNLPLPCNTPAADARGERHGRRQDPGAVGRVDRRDAGEARERERARPQLGDRDATAAADPVRERLDGRGGRDEGGPAAGGADRGADPAGRRASAADPDERDVRAGRRRRGAASSDPTWADTPTAWGIYEPAIRRWEHATGTPVPRPTDDRGRLTPAFVEWMMNLPVGWTEGPARTHRLRMLGNAVVPAQAELAVRLLLAGDAA